MCIGEHLDVTYGGYGLGVGVEIKEAFPNYGGGGLDVYGDKAGSFPSHIGLELDTFSREEDVVLFR